MHVIVWNVSTEPFGGALVIPLQVLVAQKPLSSPADLLLPTVQLHALSNSFSLAVHESAAAAAQHITGGQQRLQRGGGGQQPTGQSMTAGC